jgi:hypothetical protein
LIENNASHKWLIERNLLAFPFGWQRPAKTEEWVYQQYIDQLPESVFYQIVCFPWATLIDLSQRNLSKKSQSFLDQLNVAPPSTRLIRATVCQHIYAKDMLPWFHHLKITDLYWPHATQDEREIEGIRIHPFPLFPVQCERFLHEVNHIVKPIADRKFLYSFVGAYTPGLYITPVREWLFSLPLRQDAYVMKRDEWHYERQVYGEQIAEQVITQDEKMAHESRSIEYVDSLCDSVFSLCPSGSGPNSIRLWESLGYGSIPVILSDTLRLPGELKNGNQLLCLCQKFLLLRTEKS